MTTCIKARIAPLYKLYDTENRYGIFSLADHHENLTLIVYATYKWFLLIPKKKRSAPGHFNSLYTNFSSHAVAIIVVVVRAICFYLQTHSLIFSI